jgi:hypothetical protein
MPHQPTTPPPQGRPTATAERDATTTMRRLWATVAEGAHPDTANAAAGWRQTARLASRLQREAHAIAKALEDQMRDGSRS